MSSGERIKELRKALEIRQGDFAKKLSTTQGHISDIENGRKNLSDRTIKLICLENWNGHTVRESWLRTGEGEMFTQITTNEQVSSFIGRTLLTKPETAKQRMILALATMSDAECDILEEILSKLLKKE